MCPMQYYQIMRLCKDKKAYRYQIVVHAQTHGVKPAARAYKTSPGVVRIDLDYVVSKLTPGGNYVLTNP